MLVLDLEARLLAPAPYLLRSLAMRHSRSEGLEALDDIGEVVLRHLIVEGQRHALLLEPLGDREATRIFTEPRPVRAQRWNAVGASAGC